VKNISKSSKINYLKKFCYGLVTIMVILTMYSCKGKLIDEFYLSSEMKAQIPFQGYENITFTRPQNERTEITSRSLKMYKLCLCTIAYSFFPDRICLHIIRM